MNDKERCRHAELRELHHIMNEVLDLRFTYIAVDNRHKGMSYLHIVTPEWLEKCTMMPFMRDSTLCSNSLDFHTDNGYGTNRDRKFYTEIPDPVNLPRYKGKVVELWICKMCLHNLKNVIWPQFDDDEALEGLEYDIQIDKPKKTGHMPWRGL